MRELPSFIDQPGSFAQAWRNYPIRWLAPAILGLAAASLYLAVVPRTWQARQTLLLRNEASGNPQGAGKFVPEERKISQETVLEIAKSRGVLERTLVQVGPGADYRHPDAWPRPQDVVDLGDALKIVPPRGSEFGSTEVFYLLVSDASRERAVALAKAVSEQLQLKFQQLRENKSRSVSDELERAVQLAAADANEATGRLAEFERRLGGDLTELRAMNDATAGDVALRRQGLELENELRQSEIVHRNNEELLHLLQAAQQDQGRLLATPSRLFDSQPSLRRLKEGLVDAQLRTAQLQGTMSIGHPNIQAARAAEREVADHLHSELALAVRGLEVDLRLSADRVASLQDRLTGTRDRLAGLAGQRAEYATLIEEVQHRTKLLESAQQELASTRGNQAGMHSASLLSSLDDPDAGIRPEGPGASLILLFGLAGGLVIGCGFLVLAVPPNLHPGPAYRPAFSQPAPDAGRKAGLSLNKALRRVQVPS